MTDIEPTGDAMREPDPNDEGRRQARRRLADATARAASEVRVESREQVREIMGWA